MIPSHPLFRKAGFVVLAAALLLGFLFLFNNTYVSAQVARIQQRLLGNADSSFSYQGYLDEGASPANGSYDFRFSLFDAASGGNQVGATQSETLVVHDGVFIVTLNSADQFGNNPFDGSELFVEIQIWDEDSSGFVTLTPRQALTAVPYAHFAKKVEPPDNVITVAKSGGDFTTITDALNTITDASANNLYLIQIAPGIYEESINLKSYVDIEGSGENTTIIRSTGANTTAVSTGLGATLRASGNIVAEVRYLSVESLSTEQATAIWAGNVPENMLKFTHISAKATTTGGTSAGIVNYQSSPIYRHITVFSSTSSQRNYGIRNYDAPAPTIIDASISATSNNNYSYGIRNEEGTTATLTDVDIHIYDGSFAMGIISSDSTATITNVTILVENGQSNIGIGTYTSQATVKNAIVTVSSGTTNTGILIQDDSVVELADIITSATDGIAETIGLHIENSDVAAVNLQAYASGSGSNLGIITTVYGPAQRITMNNIISKAENGIFQNKGFSNSASIILNNANLSASGTPSDCGFCNNGNGFDDKIVEINDATMNASNPFRNDNHFTTFIGTSKLTGGTVNNQVGILTCVESYDGNYEALDSQCQNPYPAPLATGN